MIKTQMTKEQALNGIYRVCKHGQMAYGRIFVSPALIGSFIRLIEIPNEQKAENENIIMRMWYQEHKTVEEIVAFLNINNIPADIEGIKKFLKI
jgi:hypothetical protein